MSTEINPMIKEDEISKMSKVKYQNLKSHFDKLGLPSGTFQIGISKAKLIDKAVNLLSSIRTKAVADTFANKPSITDALNETPVDKTPVADKYAHLTKDDVEIILKKLDANEKQCTKEQMYIIRRKRIEYQEVLAKL